MSDDTVMVQPVRTFLEGSDLKHPESEAYPVSRSRMLELHGNGLVEHVEGERAPAAPASPEPEALPAPVIEIPAAPEPSADLAAPRRRGRPPKLR
ncbi:hypothetical protein FV232_06935 [Methylobacterium sp. WL30]|uniref:hypothetical protein n=1 Tax=unclassified Methylobacterium TaxID=2615210 RepID=UPI0011C83292|nr:MULTISPECIES: hypothetical protein [unclassified Methylobacterium]TXN40444.1 hypothetical protein FV225_06170 [Methylobacterium sp. WL93]TXN49153.1 hypothetical protein FV227_17895 [Methylobacterium sp. WL119]TXN68966.1 hypothetical protein FV232_06935 [Methylobacterium sp. WL30]